MQTKLDFDSYAAKAPSWFQAAIQAAASLLDFIITNPITVNIQVGYGELLNQQIPANVVAEASPAIPKGVTLPYTALVEDLKKPELRIRGEGIPKGSRT